MPYPPKPPTPQAVGAALKREGFVRRQSSGVYQWTAGYAVRKCRTQPDAVDVWWWPDSRASFTPDDLANRRVLTLLRYADKLLAQGFRSQLSEGGDRLTVYGRMR